MGGDVLVFQMEIIEIKGDTVPASRCDPNTKEGCDEKETKFIDTIKGASCVISLSLSLSLSLI